MHASQQQKSQDYVLGTIDALRAQVRQINSTISSLETFIRPQHEVDNRPAIGTPVGQQGYELLGQAFPAHNLTLAFVGIFRHFAELDCAFPVLFKSALEAELAKAKKPSKRRFIATTPKDLYPGKPSLWKYAKEIAPGWMLGTNESSEKKIQLLKLACEVMGLRWDKDLKLSFH